MSIVTLRFFIYTGFLLAEYWLCPARARWVVLLAASGWFMAQGTAGNEAVCAVFAGQTLLAWLAALAVVKLPGERLRSLVTAAAVTLLAAALIWYKDFSFFADNINWLGARAGVDVGLTVPQGAAPFGISYYTLILISYVLDVRWGTVERPQGNPLKLLLFAGYFPQLVSGPFSRYNDLAPALFGRAGRSLRGLQFGLQRFLWGLFKKLVLADRLAVAVAELYKEENSTGTLVVVAAVAYVVQLYADFGGCMDIVIGVSEMFGVPLAENFCRPFSSVSLSEFWRRWHMTLGAWLKDYVLYPTMKSGWMRGLGKLCRRCFGKKASRSVPTYLGMFITWFCVGFWHGGSWRYIFGSGLFFFAMIAGGMILKPVFQRAAELLSIRTQAWSWRFFQQARTFCLFTAAISFHRRADLAAGFRAWRSVFTDWSPWVLVDGTLLTLGLDGKDLGVCALALTAMLIVSMVQQRQGSVREALAEQNLVFRWIIYLALFFAVVLLGCYGPGYNAADFIYAGF